MLSVNRKIACDALRANTIWLKKPELKTKEVFNWLISKGKKVLIEVTCRLSKEELYEVNKLESKRMKYFELKIDF